LHAQGLAQTAHGSRSSALLNHEKRKSNSGNRNPEVDSKRQGGNGPAFLLHISNSNRHLPRSSSSED
jgi:hypothetical protein